MILAEEIRCLIPTDTAVKMHEIACSTNATNSSEIWTAVGTCFGVLVTAIMAIFAYKAWRTSQTQLKLTRDIAMNEQRIPALLDFLEGIEKHAELSGPDSAVSAEAKNRLIFPLHDRWVLTYPEILNAKHLRGTLASIPDLIAAIESLGRYLPAIDSNRDHVEFMKLANAKLDAETFLRELKNEVRNTCLAVHNNTMSALDANAAFEKSEKALDEASRTLVGLVPLLRLY